MKNYIFLLLCVNHFYHNIIAKENQINIIEDNIEKIIDKECTITKGNLVVKTKFSPLIGIVKPISLYKCKEEDKKRHHHRHKNELIDEIEKDLKRDPKGYFVHKPGIKHKSLIMDEMIFPAKFFCPGSFLSVAFNNKNNKIKIKLTNNFFGGGELYCDAAILHPNMIAHHKLFGIQFGVMQPAFFNEKVTPIQDAVFFIDHTHGDFINQRSYWRAMPFEFRNRICSIYFTAMKYIRISANWEISDYYCAQYSEVGDIKPDYDGKIKEFFLPTGIIRIGDQRKNNFIISFGDFITGSFSTDFKNIKFYGFYTYSKARSVIRCMAINDFEPEVQYFADRGVNQMFFGGILPLYKKIEMKININFGYIFGIFSGKKKPLHFVPTGFKKNHRSNRAILFNKMNAMLINANISFTFFKYLNFIFGASYYSKEIGRSCEINKHNHNIKHVLLSATCAFNFGRMITQIANSKRYKREKII